MTRLRVPKSLIPKDENRQEKTGGHMPPPFPGCSFSKERLWPQPSSSVVRDPNGYAQPAGLSIAALGCLAHFLPVPDQVH